PRTTAKLSSLLLKRTGLTFAGDVKPASPYPRSAERRMSPSTGKSGRRRRSSSLMYTEPPESLEHISDQAVLPNLNSEWVNAKGAWVIHFVLIICLKILFDIIPGVSQETSWTLTNISYMFGSYLMFHWVRGVPFDFNAGAYDNLNMWEQIDNGAQYTPAKKFLLSVPIVLFLVSTHYTHYDLTYFTINVMATLAVVIPKLPALHRLRIGLFNTNPEDR
ncbi:sphingolipid homeostasis protein orm1, partial [Cryomyces antarcticus]